MEGHTLTRDQLAHRFNYHPPTTEDKVEAHQLVRQICLQAANGIVGATGGPSREQSLAVARIEEAMFWANAAIAREISPNG